ncbi:WD40 repeat-like protein [Macrolepiota fuliginosa MF-IS2]|uniref:WD40 repeat-like protein n=1 Tax=Macrolepiota fuliginosa MF-IS2 TaxID=1400762 RepID=A0A9P6C3G0_9AGAR|nr:WD40 repeat-like protein [Macrolepiota fuliginosa MF-IS2]
MSSDSDPTITTSVPPHPVSLVTLLHSLTTPSTWQITALAFGHAGHLYAGSDNGDLRVYDLSSFRVLRAVKGNGDMISSIVCIKRPGSEFRDAWILKFQLDTPNLIQTYDDALETIIAIPDDDNEDEVQDLALNWDKNHLAFGTDSGSVGVIDLATKAVVKLKNKHDIMCGSVEWIPERLRELVSGGCDATLLHMDVVRDEVLSKQNLAGLSTQDDKVSMSPPFIMSLAVAPNGIVAAGTADGKLWLGFGGEKTPSASKNKKKTKWGGLELDLASIISVAEAPIVAVAFHSPTRLTVSTLKGAITHYKLIYGNDSNAVIYQALWHQQCNNMIKVNALVVDEKRVIIGGFDEAGKGVIDIWRFD